ncbi:MAG: hypothetical protein P4L53_05270 [Candidatus Obscuribacterales bacterium]|nr:hypothetical protein [Candidatus Obscuribacterales bacterium]
MFLSLEKPAGKGVSIFARNLVPEADFAPHRPNYDFDSERHVANSAIREANENLGEKLGKHSKAFGMMFNQFNWESTTGWEYWSEDFQLMLRHALLVSEALHLPLSVHASIMDKCIVAAIALGVSFDFDLAKFEGSVHAEFEYTKRDIDSGSYFTLKDIRVPA